MDNIFIADDNEINRLLLQSQLEGLCNDITLAGDGKTALNYLQKNKYGLILLDIQMPYYTGLELIKIIKQPDSINKNTPTIAITAQAQSHQRKDLIDANFDECLIKPILLKQLEEIINLWLPTGQPSTLNINNNDYIGLLLQKTSGNTKLTRTIFNKLFIELPSQLFLIERALKMDNLILAREVTHKLHGSVSFCGFVDIQIHAHNLETNLLEKNTALMLDSFDQLKGKVNDLILQKNAIFKKLK